MKQLLLSFALLLSTITLSAQNSNEAGASKPDSLSKQKVDSADLYGYIPQKPIKVGGSPTKQRQYLESLRDAQGSSIEYERMGSCCEYPSVNGFMGYALLDKYQITYYDQSNKKQKAIVYISFYDYQKPKPIKGFTFAD